MGNDRYSLFSTYITWVMTDTVYYLHHMGNDRYSLFSTYITWVMTDTVYLVLTSHG